MKKTLSSKQMRFIDEFMFDLNKTQAAIRAGYSKNSASHAGVRLYKHKLVRAEIDKRKQERSKRTNIDSDYVLTRMAEIDQLDILDVLDEHGNFLPIISWPRVWRISISGFDVSTVGKGDEIEFIKKIKWPDKVKNLEMIGKHVQIGAWGDKEDDGPKSNNDVNIYIVKLPDNGR